MTNDQTALRLVGYVRVSTTEQASSGLGLAAQEATIRAACAAQGADLVELVHDDGVSAKDLNRPGLQHALTLMASGHADGLIVSKLDRLTRSTVDLLHLLEWSERARVALIAHDLGLDTSTPTGRLVAKVMGSVVEWEREMIGARTREAASVRRARGERMGRSGVRDSRPDIATQISSRRAAGATWQAIANELNETGVPTVRGGTHWRVSAVQTAAGYQRPPASRGESPLPVVGRRRRAVASGR